MTARSNGHRWFAIALVIVVVAFLGHRNRNSVQPPWDNHPINATATVRIRLPGRVEGASELHR